MYAKLRVCGYAWSMISVEIVYAMHEKLVCELGRKEIFLDMAGFICGCGE